MSLPVRVGIAGLGRWGAYHFERLLLRDDFCVTAVCDEPSRTAFTERYGCRRHADWNAFLADENFDVLLIATDTKRHAELVVAGLRAGKHVVVEPPLAFTAEGADALTAKARAANRLLGVVEARRGDGEYRTALECLHSQKLGELLEAKFRRWGPVLPMTEHEATPGLAMLGMHAGPLLDQALQLAGRPPISVVARAYGPDAQHGFAAVLTFPNGSAVTIDCDARSLAPVHTGWTIIGTHGTYHQGRQYAAAADGEVFDVPLEPRPTDPDRWYRELRQRLATPARWLESAEQNAAVVRTIEALWKSIQGGEPMARASVNGPEARPGA